MNYMYLDKVDAAVNFCVVHVLHEIQYTSTGTLSSTGLLLLCHTLSR